LIFRQVLSVVLLLGCTASSKTQTHHPVILLVPTQLSEGDCRAGPARVARSRVLHVA
jgi:hypothetical protein